MNTDSNVVIFATRSCQHSPVLEKYLKQLGIEYTVSYFEDNPDKFEQLGLRHSPNLIVDGEVVFEDMPSLQELRRSVGESAAES
ncbi:glutaredoxin family protein [Salinibacter ruber]|jgi:glutaredoxin|uniref:Glutaredoxin n=1 Tax=Salinibacter ruber TaxID=146919 RepID=A0A9X2TNU2_9BACT|nr:thioredoxin family protein [Salinibacter ruber]MCS3659992.1 glutaredoxin [Salinibacter ruber]MCS3709677.1 glutaredoxin [Salinibacter ruber]MCS3751457.1 glutaredoxin [Salinibacter ruber]MCS4170496.1 glutaredoxin [Salinibacter ruber]